MRASLPSDFGPELSRQRTPEEQAAAAIMVEAMRERYEVLRKLGGFTKVLPGHVTLFAELPADIAAIVRRAQLVPTGERLLPGTAEVFTGHPPCPKDGDTRRKRAGVGRGHLLCPTCVARWSRNWRSKNKGRSSA